MCSHLWLRSSRFVRDLRLSAAIIVEEKASGRPAKSAGKTRATDVRTPERVTCLMNGIDKKRRVSSGAKARIFLVSNVGAEVPTPNGVYEMTSSTQTLEGITAEIRRRRHC